MEIVPMCLYKINEQQDFLTYPTVFRIDDSTQYLCKVRENMEYVRNFYVISPDFRPIPIGTKLYCAINSYESTLQIKQVYDVFNDDIPGCMRFIAWNKIVPGTIPLYIQNNNGKVKINFNDSEKYDMVIYVMDKPMLFSLIDDRCIPDINGEKLGNCMSKYLKKTDTGINNIMNSIMNSNRKINYIFILGLILICFVCFNVMKKFMR